jgi:hypothetical protein
MSQINRIDTDEDENESIRDESGSPSGGILSNYPLHPRSSCSSVVGFLPSVGSLSAMPLLLWQGCVSDASGAGDANEKASQSPHSRSLRRTFRKKVPAPSPSLPSVKNLQKESEQSKGLTLNFSVPLFH